MQNRFNVTIGLLTSAEDQVTGSLKGDIIGKITCHWLIGRVMRGLFIHHTCHSLQRRHDLIAGDMRLKNFGVTRHGRVVFYDYDEICPLTDCHFRWLPELQTEEQVFACQPWYHVAANNILPEEFGLFFSGNQRARHAFEALHRDLYDPAWWIALQDKIKASHAADALPYRKKQRFQQRPV